MRPTVDPLSDEVTWIENCWKLRLIRLKLELGQESTTKTWLSARAFCDNG
ncbi:MAG: hypothetical protein QXU75_08565 [Candidatus Methanomethylicaceae archaeon]